MTTTTYKPISVMKKELRRIVRDIDKEQLYSELKDPLKITPQAYEEFDTAESYLIEQLINDELRPWAIAECLRSLGHPIIADNLEMFASTFDFSMDTEVKNVKLSMDTEVKNVKTKRVIMATEKLEMKQDLRKIARKIEPGLYKQLRDTFLIPDSVAEKFPTADLYISDQYLSDQLEPWRISNELKALKCDALAEQFEEFARKYKFPETESVIEKAPEKVILELLKLLKLKLTQDQLLGLRESNSETFETIFYDLLDLNLLTPSLDALKNMLQDEDREDLASEVVFASNTLSKLEPVAFHRVVTLCLDTLNVDIFCLLSDLREALSKEYSLFQSLSKQFNLSTDFIPLTFTEEVDTRTLPLTEGADAELQTLIKNAKNQSEKKTRYINAHVKIYSPKLNQKLISLIGHPGSGKTFYCKKIINEFANKINDAYRFILLLSCRNSQWHTIEETYRKNPHQTPEMLHNLLVLAVPTFNNSQELVPIILKTEGSGLLLVIDSFDEFPSYQHFDSTLLHKILKRQVLTKATILITSRPGAWNKLLSDYKDHFVFQHPWQLIGFSPEQRDKFIHQQLSPIKAESCHNFLSNKTELNLLSLVPVNIGLITGLVDSTDLLKHINTLTDVYTSLVLFTLDRQLKRLDEHSTGINSLSEMPADMLNEFNKLAELSYEGLVARQITFSSSEIDSVTSGKYTKGLGLFHIIKVMTKQLTVIDYLSCPHLTFQEFLSAWHLSQKSPVELVTIIQKIFTDNTWLAKHKVCIRFLCGILTQSRNNTIIPIIINNLHMKCAVIKCAHLLHDSGYYRIQPTITASHLSVLPCVLETQDSSIIASYHQLLCPDNTTIPHFYLSGTISPVDAYCISEFTSKLPQYSIASVLSIDISELTTTRLDALHEVITSISIDTLIVKFNISDTEVLEEYVKDGIHRADILYEVQQLHVSNRHELVDELQSTSWNTMRDIFTLQRIMSYIKLSINSLHISSSQYQPLLYLISNITNNIFHTLKHIHYEFNNLNLLDDVIINAFIDTLQSTATYAMFKDCNFTPQFMSRFVMSQPNLAYLAINNQSLVSIQLLCSHPMLDESTFIHLNKLPIKGLYLHGVTLPNDYSVLYDYLLSHTCLQELEISRTTHSTSAVLSYIQHLSTLRYIRIEAEDEALATYQSSTETSMLLYLSVLNRNRLTLSCVDFSYYSYFLTARYDTIMHIFSQCHNLQYINISHCSLTSDHMHALATTINSLPALVHINIGNNSDISDIGLIKLYEPLTSNNTVRYINLEWCGLSFSSIPVIKSLINKCACLLKIDLLFKELDKEDLIQFAEQRNIDINIIVY